MLDVWCRGKPVSPRHVRDSFVLATRYKNINMAVWDVGGPAGRQMLVRNFEDFLRPLFATPPAPWEARTRSAGCGATTTRARMG